MNFFNNPFNDPSSPWYYVIGILFLVLIFAALGVYIYFSNKKKKKSESEPNNDESISADTEVNKDAAEERETNDSENNN